MLATTKEIKYIYIYIYIYLYGQPDPHVCGSLSLSPQNCVDSHEVIQNEAKLQEIVVPELNQ